jgi:hypothetical protein
MPFEEDDAWGAGAGGGGGDACLAGLGAGAGFAGLGAGAGLAATVACDCFAAGAEFELLPLLPPQLATPTAMRRIAAPLARKVIGLLRFMAVPSGQGLKSKVPCRWAVCRRPEGDTFACNRGGSSSGSVTPSIVG